MEITQSIPTPEQFLRFVTAAKQREDVAKGCRSATNGTLKLLEQLGLERRMGSAQFEQLRSKGYGEAVDVLRQMGVEIV